MTSFSDNVLVWVPFEVEKKYDGQRVDQFLAQRLGGYSRNKVQAMLKDARVFKGERPAKANTRVKSGDRVRVAYPRRPEKELAADASLPILYEDKDLIIVDKPADLLSHPTDKVVKHTVLGVLRHARPDLPKLHLLHRLDRETSGVLALAKNPAAAKAWGRAMEKHEMQKEYLAILHGCLSPNIGVIDMPIGKEGGAIRVRQWVNTPDAVPAVTRYEVIRQSKTVTVVRAWPQTGRLHQIRVHFAALGYPLLGDPLYTGNGEIYARMVAGEDVTRLRQSLGFPRVALHATAITFLHPMTRQPQHIEASLPADMSKCWFGIDLGLMGRINALSKR